jgi:transcriptional regulator with XRE-family HTH domain
MQEIQIGKKIRQLRLRNKLTLGEVAKRTGFTEAYISMVERGKKSPPIATLSKIGRALDVDIAAFFEQKKPEEQIIRVSKGEGKKVVRDGNTFGYQYESIAPTKRHKKMEPFIVSHLVEMKRDGRFDHEGEEFFYVLEGEIRFVYGDKEYLLGEGDCLYFDSSIPHRGISVGKKSARVLVVVCP